MTVELNTEGSNKVCCISKLILSKDNRRFIRFNTEEDTKNFSISTNKTTTDDCDDDEY